MSAPLVVAQIIGGLGNQLFQYATARALAQRLGLPLALDISGFDQYPLRRFQLDRFRVSIRRASMTDLFLLNGQHRFYRTIIPRNWQFYVIQEAVHHYHEIQIPNNFRKLYLLGYWQSEKYFQQIADLIREEIRLPDEPKGLNADLLAQIQNTDAVSIHVRRGDYITNPIAAAWHGACELDYYQRAIAYIEKQTQRPQFYIFSDDIPWVKANLHINHPTTYVDHNANDPCEDLRLMSACKHFIIANSSFSWWGAWLAEYSQKIVIAPKRWFLTPDKNDRDQVPETWIRM